MASSSVDTLTNEATAHTRDRFPDLLRSLALGAVILGHWTMGAVSVDAEGMMHVDNVLNTNRSLWPVTWVLVLIPWFFFVGGFSNATSLKRAKSRSLSSAQWVRKRLASLLLPVLPFVLVVVALVLVALQLGAPKVLTATIAVVVLMPLWFVIVYAVLALLTPLLFAAHQRYGVWVVVALIALACLSDGLRTFLDEPLIGWANYIFVHGTAQQIGFFYFDGRLTQLKKSTLLVWAGLSFALLCAAVATPIWSQSMVGLSGERSNMSPPSIPSLLHTLLLIAVAMLIYPWLKQRIDAPKIARVLDVAAHYSMRAFLWHLPVMVLVMGLIYVVGLPFPMPGTAVWWATRPLVLTVLALALVGWLKVGDAVRRKRTQPALPTHK